MHVKIIYLLMQNCFVVSGCTENKFGESCTSECPPCENGGICDDKNGTCICPPGFMGKWCEIGNCSFTRSLLGLASYCH